MDLTSLFGDNDKRTGRQSIRNRLIRRARLKKKKSNRVHNTELSKYIKPMTLTSTPPSRFVIIKPISFLLYKSNSSVQYLHEYVKLMPGRKKLYRFCKILTEIKI